MTLTPSSIDYRSERMVITKSSFKPLGSQIWFTDSLIKHGFIEYFPDVPDGK